MSPPLKNSPRAFSPLQNSSVTYATFSDALVALGFTQARGQNFEWLTSYPEARPLLDAIQTSFTPQCVLTQSESAAAAKILTKTPQLPDEQLYLASRPLSNGSAQYPDVHCQRQSRLEAARKRLSMLKKQKEVLEEVVSQKRARPKAVLSPRTPPLRRNRSGEEQPLQLLADELAATTITENFFMGAEAEVALYCEKEEAVFEEIRSYDKQAMHDDVPDAHSDLDNTKNPSLRSLVDSYAAIKSHQYIHEVRLARANAMLTYVNLNKLAYTEMPLASMRSLIKDLRERAAKAMKARAKKVGEQAREALWNQLQEIALSDTLRQQELILEVARFCAVRCLEQRLRIQTFHAAVKAQEKRHAEVLNALLQLSLRHNDNFEENENTVNSERKCTTQLDELQRVCEESVSYEDGESANIVVSLEDDAFHSAIETLAEILTDFANRIGCDDSWLRLESHPEYAPLVEDYERVLSYNTSILEAVLKRRGSPKALSPRSRNWAQIVNSSR